MSIRSLSILNLLKTKKYEFLRKLSNPPLNSIVIHYSTEVTVQATPLAVNTQKVSKAMKAYLQRAQEQDQFMKAQNIEYQIGKRHLANMMGEDPETFTQEDVDNAIEYLFPSGIYDKLARPALKSPDQVFPARKAAEFDETGRPFHSMFYTGRPNFFKLLYNIVDKIDKLNDMEERMLRRGTFADAEQKIDLTGFQWLPKDQLEKQLVEMIADIEYNNFVNAMDRLVTHPYSYKQKDFIYKYTKPLLDQSKQPEIPKPQIDKLGKQFITTYECLRKRARADVTLRLPGTGKFQINGEDITYFEHAQCREQLFIPLKGVVDEFMQYLCVVYIPQKRFQESELSIYQRFYCAAAKVCCFLS